MSLNQPEATEDNSDVTINLRSVIVQVGGATESVTPPTVDPDPFEAVMAHGALNSMAVLLGALQAISGGGTDLDPEQTRLLGVATEQGRMVVAALRDLDLRLPVGATGVLDDLDEEARQRHGARDVTAGTLG